MKDERPGDWTGVTTERVFRSRVFDVYRSVKRRGDRLADFYAIDGVDWTNIIPIDERGNVILIEQYRHGIDGETLEIPGGCIDPGDPSPADAAIRELREETGYVSSHVSLLGVIHPNPAIQRNRCHSFLALDARRVADPASDEHEEITVRPTPLTAIPSLIESGSISHALVVVAFSFLTIRHPMLFSWDMGRAR